MANHTNNYDPEVDMRLSISSLNNIQLKSMILKDEVQNEEQI